MTVKEVKTTHGVAFNSSENETILDSALKHGYVFEYSCKNGQCGTCKTELLEGEVRELHAQIALSEKDLAENKILTCCCAAESDLLINSEDLSALHGIELKTLPCRIKSIDFPVDSIAEVVLKISPTASFGFLEGQYIDVIGPNSVRRSYSIANSSSVSDITLYIKKVVGGQLSNYWFEAAKANDLLRFEGPKGTFFLRAKQERLIFLATGTGISPIISMLNQLDESLVDEDDFKVELYWGNRHADEFFWEPQYKNIDIEYTPVISRENKNWFGSVGYVQDVLLNKGRPFNGCNVYACGSIEMIESAKSILLTAGLSEKHFFSDAFVSSSVK